VLAEAIRDQFASVLKDAGYDVESQVDPSFDDRPPRPSDKLEITITRSTGSQPGARLRITGFRADAPDHKAIGIFLADPVEAADLVRAIKTFEGN
jgi:hypothetical protein